MGPPVDLHELGVIDRGVALGGRERGVSQELLDGAEIAAIGQEVGGEAVAQRVRRRRLRQPQQGAQRAQPLLHDAGGKPLAAHADEQRTVGPEMMGAGGDIRCDALAHDVEHRHHALLVALAGDHHGVTLGRLAAVQRQRFAEAQAATVKQREKRRVALGDPWPAAELAGAFKDLARFRRRQRLGHRSRHLRRAHAL